MSIVFAMFYGLIQGLSEFLPISSSAHLTLLDAWIGGGVGGEDRLAFEVLLHLGTLGAVVLAYRRDLFSLARGGLAAAGRWIGFRSGGEQSEDGKIGAMLLIACLPMAAAPLLLPLVERICQMPILVGLALCVNGVFLLFTSQRSRRFGTELAPRHAFWIGVSQLVALIPGFSRSGTTAGCGMLCGMGREDAVRFSFLLSIPTVLGANLLKLPALFAQGMEETELLGCFVGCLTAFLSGSLAIGLLRRLVVNKTPQAFGYYCLALGVTAMVLLS